MAKIVNEILIYNFFAVINSILPFILTPLLTNYLNPEEVGLISLITVSLGVLSIFISLNTHYPITIKFNKKTPSVINLYILSAALISSLVSLLLIVVLIILGDKVSETMKISKNLIFFLIFLSWLQSLINISFALLQIQRKVLFYNGMMLTSTLLNCGISIILVVYGGFGWQGRIIGIVAGIITSACFGLYSVFLFQKEHSLLKRICVPPLPIIKDTFSIGNSLLIFSLSGVVISYIDRYLISLYCDLSSLGFYSVAYSFAMIPSIFATTMNRAWFPHFSKFLGSKYFNKVDLMLYLLVIFISIILVGALVVYLTPMIFRSFIGDGYDSSIELIPWLAAAYVFEGISTIIGGAYLILNKGFMLSRLVFASAVLNVILTFILVLDEGVVGAAKAMLLTYIFLFISYYVICPRFIDLPVLGICTRKN